MTILTEVKKQDDYCVKKFQYCRHTNRTYLIKGCANYKVGNVRKKTSVRDCPQCGKETRIEWVKSE
jgi:hypothetical protein